MAIRCPADDTVLTERRDDTIAYFVCGTCGGAWIPAEVTRGLLKGAIQPSATLSAYISERPRRYATPVNRPEPAHAGHAPAGRVAPLPRKRCSECRARMRPNDANGVTTCTRCGALWIERHELGALAEWYRNAVQVRAAAAMQPTRIRYGQWRDVDEHGDFSRMLVILVGAFGFFILLAPLNGGSAYFGHRIRTLLLGLGGIGLVVYGFQFPSRQQPGALSRKGFAFALAGVALGIAALFDWA